MIKEHDRIVLKRDIPEKKLEAGDLGTVISIYQDGVGYTVEFMSLKGETIAIEDLYAKDVREINEGDVAHVRAAE
ncbi:MAG: DUF4926 domain-containing protein [Hyphomicrobiaceae bacterium]|nr:DUF4926 domain-containing protein [Hyphomicrobiaceae bacterium]